jgi:hypothetical protein
MGDEMTKRAGRRGAQSAFQKPFVDIDEWREEPVRHRYVHGLVMMCSSPDTGCIM